MTASLSNRLWRHLSQGGVARAVLELRHEMPDVHHDRALIWTHVVAATPGFGSDDLRRLGAAVSMGGRMPARGLGIVVDLSRAITAEDWHRAARRVGAIRHYAPDTNRVELVGLLVRLERNRNGELSDANWMMNALGNLIIERQS